jgi:isochorismate synthase
VNKSKFPIVYYRMPYEKNVWLIQSGSEGEEINNLNNVPEKPGFILYPFAGTGACKPLFIYVNEHIKMTVEDVYKAIQENNAVWEINASSIPDNISKSKEEYLRIVADAVMSIQSGMLQKVVLSRVKTIKNTLPQNPLKIFYKLCIKYPGAFVSMVYIPKSVLWITATPELLLSANNNEINTVSLAGTKPADSIEEWGEKEKQEQQIVTDYINEILKKYCENVTISGPNEIIAGNVKHLKTSFSAKLNTELWNLVSALYPTPAVCGIPLDNARRFIKQTEGYDRKYYTGFLGPCNIDGATNLYANLRSAEIFANSVNLYIGGGITKNSIPEKEWEETELKSKTLLFAFEENEEK